MAIRTTLIVGYPGETEEDFMDTMDLVEQVGFGQAYSFKYSTRPGTPAAERAQVDEDVKSERLQRLQALLGKQQKAAQDAMVGRETTVLFEKQGRDPGQLIGKSENLHAVHAFADKSLIGTVRRVRIIKSLTNSLTGELI